MGSKRLNLSQNLPVLTLPDSGEDVMVPASGGRYIVPQPEENLRLIFHLTHPGTTVQIEGKIQTTSSPSISIDIVHSASDTRAETIFRTLATESASPRFEGKIVISPNATGCESYLNHHSLVFDNAKSYSWPALEIENNDVKCSHAATVRTITDMDLFYARSRGLSKNDARTMLVEAFLAD